MHFSLNRVVVVGPILDVLFDFNFVKPGVLWYVYMPFAHDASHWTLNVLDSFRATAAVCAILLASADVFCLMVYFVGVIVPGRGVEVPAGYELSTESRRKLSATICGVPINVQHRGIRTAVRSVVLSGHKLEATALRAALLHVGAVRYSWVASDGGVWAIFDVGDEYELVLWLIEGGHLQGLSLSHIGACTPVELSLCSVPARGCCFLRGRFSTLEDAFTYKLAVDRGTYTSTRPLKMAESPPAMSALETVLSQLSDIDRTLVQARLTEMVGKVDDARLSERHALGRLEKMAAIKDTDKRMFDEQWKYLMGMLKEEAPRYAVTAETAEVLKSAPAEVLHHVGQLVKCASASIAAARHPGTAERSVKRQRLLPDPDVGSAAAAPASELTPLGRALASTFT